MNGDQSISNSRSMAKIFINSEAPMTTYPSLNLQIAATQYRQCLSLSYSLGLSSLAAQQQSRGKHWHPARVARRILRYLSCEDL